MASIPRALPSHGEELLLVVDLLGARGGHDVELLRELDGVAGAGLLAHPAVDAAEHVDLEHARALVAVRPRRLLGHDADAVGGADRLAHEAGHALLAAELVLLQAVLAAVPLPHGPLLLRVLDREGPAPPGLQDVAEGVL